MLKVTLCLILSAIEDTMEALICPTIVEIDLGMRWYGGHLFSTSSQSNFFVCITLSDFSTANSGILLSKKNEPKAVF